MWTTLAFLSCAALAGSWKQEEINPKVLTDVTAFTLDKRDWRVGLFQVHYGLLTNTQIGTTHALYWLKVPNAQVKITAIQTPKLDVSLQAGWFYKDFADLGLKGLTTTITPIGWTASWTPHHRWGIHFGQDWTLASLDGRVTVRQIGRAVGDLTGADITDDLIAAVGKGDALYGGANLNLLKVRFAIDYRLNRRDSIVFISNTYVAVSGLLAAGASVDVEGIDAEVGASARVRVPLSETLPSLNSLSWQWSWKHFHLRIGVPLPLTNYFAYPQALNFNWVLGPKHDRDQTVEVEDTPEPQDIEPEPAPQQPEP